MASPLPAESPPTEKAETPFQFLREATPSSLVRHLQGQHPQVIAVVLAHLPPEQSAEVLKRLPPALQAGVLRRIAELDIADPSMVEALEEHLKALLSDEIRISKNHLQGISAIAAILSAAGSEQGELLSNLHSHAPALAAAIEPPGPRLPKALDATAERPGSPSYDPSRKSATSAAVEPQPLDSGTKAPKEGATHQAVSNDQPGTAPLRFEQLSQLEDLQLAGIFAQVPADVVVLALSGANPDFVARLLRQLPPRDARSLQKDIARISPVRLGDIEHAQRQVLEIAQDLLRAGMADDRNSALRNFAAAA